MIPIATRFSLTISGTFHPHIICPIDRYINGIKKQREAINRFFISGVSLSFNSPLFSILPASCPVLLSFSAALYPAASTASITVCASTAPSTPIELVSRFTEHDVTPSIFDTAFSTRALHAAQLIPVTSYCFNRFPPFDSQILDSIAFSESIS